MFRAFLTTVLTVLVALPHGVCFCDFLHAEHADHADHFGHDDHAACGDEAEHSGPAAPDETPEADCSCVLREAMACAPAFEPDGAVVNAWLGLAPAPQIPLPASPTNKNLSPEDDPDGPIPLILCALRI